MWCAENCRLKPILTIRLSNMKPKNSVAKHIQNTGCDSPCRITTQPEIGVSLSVEQIVTKMPHQFGATLMQLPRTRDVLDDVNAREVGFFDLWILRQMGVATLIKQRVGR